MRVWLAASAAALLLAAAATTAARGADAPLSVCLDEDLPPLSAHQHGKPDSGFDVALAQAVADRLGRPLKIQWFESKLDEDTSPPMEANALLSDGRCSLVGGYTFTKDALVVPGAKTAKLPGFEGATRDDRRRRVPVGVLTPSQPYIYLPMTVVVGPKARERKIAGIGDLAGLRIAINRNARDAPPVTFEEGTADRHVTHLVPGPPRPAQRTDGDFDATLLDLRRFDAYRAARPDTKIAASGYFYPIGANRGYVGLATDPSLLAAVNKALSELQAAGTIAELGRAAGLTYLPPREPAILGDVWLKILQKQD
jgi:ABC-type amino acid transport substrate-binding protein